MLMCFLIFYCILKILRISYHIAPGQTPEAPSPGTDQLPVATSLSTDLPPIPTGRKTPAAPGPAPSHWPSPILAAIDTEG